MEGMRKISLGVVENNHSCCSAFLSGFSRCWAWDFQPNKSQDFCPIRWAFLGQTVASVSRRWTGECLPLVLVSTQGSGLAVLHGLLDGEHDGGVLVLEVHAEKERFVTRKFNNWLGTLIEKTAAGRKKGNLASGLLVVVSAVLSLYVVQHSGAQWC